MGVLYEAKEMATDWTVARAEAQKDRIWCRLFFNRDTGMDTVIPLSPSEGDNNIIFSGDGNGVGDVVVRTDEDNAVGLVGRLKAP